MTLMIGPLPCLTCKQPVWWDRVGTDVRLMETRRHDGRPRNHVCPPICLAMLPIAKEPCARVRGHAGSHRSRFALDSAARARRKFGWSKFVDAHAQAPETLSTANPGNDRTIAA